MNCDEIYDRKEKKCCNSCKCTVQKVCPNCGSNAFTPLKKASESKDSSKQTTLLLD
jgi:hypothetical protein